MPPDLTSIFLTVACSYYVQQRTISHNGRIITNAYQAGKVNLQRLMPQILYLTP